MKQENRNTFAAVGGSSLLVIFAVLSLTIFAMLSLNTALAQRRLTERSLAAIDAYYAADLKAETVFARLRAGERPEEVTQTENRYAYKVPLSQDQTLMVELEQGEAGWRILRWQLVADPEALRETLPVFQGG